MRLVGILLFTCILLSACVRHKIRIDANQRSEITGSINNDAQNAVNGISVVSSGSKNGFVNYLSPVQYLGFGESDANGEFSFISLNSRNSYLAISINHPDDEYYNEEYCSLNIVDSMRIRNPEINLGNIKLPRRYNLRVIFQNVTDKPDTLFYKISYQRVILNYNYKGGNWQESLRETDRSAQLGKIIPGELEDSIQIATAANSETVLRYKFSKNTDWEEEVTIEGNSENDSYELEY